MALYAESTWGTFASGGATLFPRLYQGDSFTMRPMPLRQVIRTADAGNRRIQVVSARTQVQGTLNTLLYPTQAAYWATALTPTGTPAVLPSYSIEYFDSVRVQRYLGCRVSKFTLTSTSDQDYLSMSVDFIGQILDSTFTTFAQPAQSVYPVEVPYEHAESRANILLGGSAVTAYKSAVVTITNYLAPQFDESATINSLTYCGRDLDFAIVPQYVATTYRTDFEAQTPLTWVLEWIRVAGTHNFTITCEASDYISGITDQLPLDNIGYQSLDNQVFFDKTATTDFAVTAA
jgi:hypothetical protein